MNKGAAHSLVSSCDVLQSSSCCLTGGGVDLARHQQVVVQSNYLGVPQPLSALWYSSHLSERGQVLFPALLTWRTVGFTRTLQLRYSTLSFKMCTYVLGFPAVRREATNTVALSWVLISGWSFQTCHDRRRHLSVQLVGQVSQDTHSIFHTLTGGDSLMFTGRVVVLQDSSSDSSTLLDTHLVFCLVLFKGSPDVANQWVHQSVCLSHLLTGLLIHGAQVSDEAQPTMPTLLVFCFDKNRTFLLCTPGETPGLLPEFNVTT